MSAKLKSLKDGMLAGIAAEKTKAAPVDRFALAEQAITSHPRGCSGSPPVRLSALKVRPRPARSGGSSRFRSNGSRRIR